MRQVFSATSRNQKNFERSISIFWWNSSENEGEYSLDELGPVKWIQIMWGMSFRDFRDFNVVMLGKQG